MNTFTFPNLMKNFAFIFLSLFLVSTIDAQMNERIKVLSQNQHLKFYLTENNELNAQLTVTMQVTSDESPNKFVLPVFFDNFTSVSDINLRKGRKKIKFNPRISDYESQGIFHSDLKVSWIDYFFEEKGSIINLSYIKTFKDIKFLDPLYFISYYSIDKSTITIDKPDWLNLGINEFNFENSTVSKNENQINNSTTYKYIQEDILLEKEVSNAPRRNKIKPHIILVPKSVDNNGIKKDYFNSTQEVYNWYASLVNSINNKTDNLTSIVENLIKDKSTDKEKVESIFYWVQDNIRYIAFEAGIMGFKPENCQNVFDNKYGDCKGMANLLKQMLIIAGFDARLTWLGTKDLPYTYELQSLVVDNHMICTVFLNDKAVFLDPTEKYIDMYNYAFRIQGKEAMIEDGENYIIEKIPEAPYTENKEETIISLKVEDDKLIGTGTNTFNGNRKSEMYYNLGNTTKKDWKEKIESYIGSYNKNVITKLTNDPNLDNRNETLAFNFDLEIKNRVTDIGSEIYFNPEFDYMLKDYDIDDDRKVPFEFSNVYSMAYETTIAIEEGWTVSYLPEELNVNNEKFEFDLKYIKEGNQVKYQKHLNIKEAYLEVKDFKVWNDAIKSLNTFYEDQIILKKE